MRRSLGGVRRIAGRGIYGWMDGCIYGECLHHHISGSEQTEQDHENEGLFYYYRGYVVEEPYSIIFSADISTRGWMNGWMDHGSCPEISN